MAIKNQWQKKVIKIDLGKAIVVTAVMILGSFLIGLNWKNIQNHEFMHYLGLNKKSENINWDEVDDLYDQLKNNYDGDIDKEKVVLGAKKGLVEALGDKYTEFMSLEETREFDKSLHGDVGAGIGVEMGLRDNFVKVLRTLPDNPARKAGILAGDILYKVNGEEVYNLSTDKIADKVRGVAGTEVNITVVRNKKELEFKMKREKINNVSAYVEYFDKTALIVATRFDVDTGRVIEEIAKEAMQKGTEKVILDLRNNGGGYVESAVDLLSLWLSGEKVLVQKSKHFGDKPKFSHRNKDILKNTKTVVLINGATASAAEIVAGALSDYKKAILVGEKTYGKGVVQSLIGLGESRLKVTTARWYTPDDHSINKTGIKPDKEAERSFDDINADRDPQLEAAKEI